MNVRYREQALADLDEIFNYLNERESGRSAQRAACDCGCNRQRCRAAARRAANLRPEVLVKVLGRYRYKVFYAVLDDEFLEIIHIRHGARRPWL